MPWLRISDDFMQHPKVLGLSARAVALWLEAICYVARHLTDGLVSPKVLAALRYRAAASELRHAGLWDVVPAGDQIHDYHDYQPARDEVQNHRAEVSEKRRAAGKRGAARRWQKAWQTDGNGHGKPIAPSHTHTHPIPEEHTEARPSVLADDVWQLWRTVADEHGAPVRLGVSQTQTTHLVALAGAYSLDELGAALRAWWASPYVTGRNLGLFVSQLDEVLAHVASGSRTAFRQPPDKAPARAPAQVPYRSLADWVCPHTPHCAARRGCEQRQLLDAAKAKVPSCP